MRISFSAFIFFLFLFPSMSFSQITGFIDTFEDSSPDTLWEGEPHTLWKTSANSTYGITEQNGVLSIDYNRSSQSGANDNFIFTPPEAMDISANPRMRISIKSSVSTTLNLRALYLPRPPQFQEFEQNIPGDDEWHTYTFAFDSDIFEANTLRSVSFYLDQGSPFTRSGTVQLDDFKLAGFLINITNLTAEIVNGKNIQLSWNSSEPEATGSYKVYRHTEENFTADQNTFLASTNEPAFLDEDLPAYISYFYKVVAVDALGEEYFPSKEIRAETFEPEIIPQITISGTNTAEVEKYTLFALDVELNNIGIYNPYNPNDIDVHAWFKSPGGDTTRINGFYDDYQNAGQWRVYFSPDQTGTWEYQVFVSDVGGTGESAIGTFSAVASEYHGPLKISTENPNYFSTNDNSSFYGLAAYYPWSVREDRLDRLQEYGVNMIGYWNGTYDGSGNGGGRYLIESMSSGLGKYDQRKMARIEQILGWLEKRDMKMMFAVWAHPFLRSGAPGWDPIDWQPNNPYQDIVGADEFFTDSLAWEYQKKQYRYLIARIGHHRALGIWEIINEMHGTTGYVTNPVGARAWVNKVHDYLKANDPYQRPTTASFGSDAIWTQFDIKAEITNRHYYENGGEYSRPFNDDIRDGLFNVVNVYQNLKRAANRPAMLGEAGYTSMFSDVSTFNYTQEFHNAYWSGLATGMASTPFWWDFTSSTIFTDERMEVYTNLGRFVSKLDLAHNQYEAEELDVPGSNIYYMKNDTSAFGWLRRYNNTDVSNTDFTLKGLQNGSYAIHWYNTWTGETAQVDTLASVSSKTFLATPELSEPRRDIAFRVDAIENGTQGSTLNLLIEEDEIIMAPDTSYTIVAYITDNKGLLAESAANEVTFTLTGKGSLAERTVMAEKGIAKAIYIPSPEGAEEFTVTAEADGLTSASLNNITVTENEPEEDGSLPQEFNLKQNYPNPFNPSTVISYSLKQTGNVKMDIFDIMGRKIATLLNQRQPAGDHQITFDAKELSSGIYLYRLTSESFIQTKRMILLK